MLLQNVFNRCIKFLIRRFEITIHLTLSTSVGSGFESQYTHFFITRKKEMIPQNQKNNSALGGAIDATKFGISAENSAHIINILRNTIYSDKIMAVIREYSANAFDANKSVGKENEPITIHIPTDSELYFSVTDCGPGLSHNEVVMIYTQYGASTKRDSDDYVGMLGIGSKSAFCYSDSFIVISKNQGKIRTYSAFIDESQHGTIALLNESDLEDKNETGLEIKIPVKKHDVKQFYDKIVLFFSTVMTKPNFNIGNISFREKNILADLPAGIVNDKTYKTVNHSYNYSSSEEWYALMGSIPYRINKSNVTFPDFVGYSSGYLKFEIGDINFNASREDLEYNDKTKTAIIDKFCELHLQYSKFVNELINSKAKTNWEKRVFASSLKNSGFSFSIVDKNMDKSFLDSHVKLFPNDFFNGKSVGYSFVEYSYSSRRRRYSTVHSYKTNSINVHKDTKIVIHDSKKALKFYTHNFKDNITYIATPINKSEYLSVYKDILSHIEINKAEGIEIVFTSSLKIDESFLPEKKEKSVLAGKKEFSLKENLKFVETTVRSNNWELSDRSITKNDVYVEICNFETQYSILEETILTVRAICDEIGKKAPRIFGYKIKKDHIGNSTKRVGIRYEVWLKTFVDELLSNSSYNSILKISEFANDQAATDYGVNLFSKTAFESVKCALGADHILSRFCEKYIDSVTVINKEYSSQNVKKAFRKILNYNENYKLILTDNRSEINQINDKYPLLFNDMYALIGQHRYKYIDYVKIIDKHNEQLLEQQLNNLTDKLTA